MYIIGIYNYLIILYNLIQFKMLFYFVFLIFFLNFIIENIAQIEASQYFTNHPELNDVNGAMDYITSPKKNGPKTPDKMFMKNNFGEILLIL